ncbi:MAG: DUF3333 domain-containing protein, partial [Solirubrobacterales bacterium]
MLAIETHDLVKTFGETRAVDGVDLSVEQGSIYGVLGPNGAGKTTTIRMLATLLKPDAGSAKVLGMDVESQSADIRSRISLTGQIASVDEELTGRENLRLLGKLLGLGGKGAASRADELLQGFGLGAILAAFAVLFILIGSLVGTGYSAFVQTHVTLEVFIDRADEIVDTLVS